MFLAQWRVFPEASLLDTGTEAAVRSVAIRNPYLRALLALTGVSRACPACGQAFRSGGFSGGVGSSVTFRSRDRGSLPQRQRAAAILPRALRLREVEPGREQGGGWMSGRASPPLATTDPRGDGIMQTVTAPGASARTFLIHMFRRGLDDIRHKPGILGFLRQIGFMGATGAICRCRTHHAVAAAANGGCRCGNEHEQAAYGYRAGFHGPEILWRWRLGSRQAW